MRRLLLILVVALLVVPSTAVAQTSELSIDGALDEIGVTWDGWAEKSYTIAGISFTEPYGYAFIGIDLSSEDDASTVIEKLPPVFNRMMSDSFGEDPIAFARVSAGQVGDERYAASADVESEDVEFTLGYVMARSGHFVVIGLVFGLMVAPVVEAAPYVESTLDRIADEDPTSWQELRELLPQLDDMPAGYLDDDEAATFEPTPNPTPRATPTPLAPATQIYLNGEGAYQASRLSLDPGTYKITFTCSGSPGSVTIQWGALGDATTLETGGDQSALRFYTLEAFSVSSVKIDCDGTWSLYVMPTSSGSEYTPPTALKNAHRSS